MIFTLGKMISALVAISKVANEKIKSSKYLYIQMKINSNNKKMSLNLFCNISK